MKIFSAKIMTNQGFINGFSGRRNASAIALVNEEGEFGFLPGENQPYTPAGGLKAHKAVLKMGVSYEFKPFNFGSAIIKTGRQIKI